MERLNLLCSKCDSPTKIIRTQTDPRTGHIKRRRECVVCRMRCTTWDAPPVRDKPPLTAYQAGRIDRRSARINAAMARANLGTTVTLRDGIGASPTDLMEELNKCGFS